jgi:hypothetical protein
MSVQKHDCIPEIAMLKGEIVMLSLSKHVLILPLPAGLKLSCCHVEPELVPSLPRGSMVEA